MENLINLRTQYLHLYKDIESLCKPSVLIVILYSKGGEL